MLYIFKIVSVLTFLKIVHLIVPINCKNVANLNSPGLMKIGIWYVRGLYGKEKLLRKE